MRRAFTMVELLVAVLLTGVLTAVTMMTFYSVTNSWQVSTDYIDKLQRTDFALNQVVGGLRSMYYPHDGKQDEHYGFVLIDNGDGADPDRSDTIEWSKIGTAIVGNKSAVADSVHRVQVMVLEAGNRDWKEEIQKTGLYARQCPDVALRPKDDEVDYSFGNDEMYQPVLIADGIVGFNCRVMKTPDDVEEGENVRAKFEDEWTSSNSVPYKVELTFRIADPEGRAYRSNTAPIVRIVKIPIFEQSQDGATTPSDEAKDRQKGPRPGGIGGGRTPGGTGGAGGGRAPGGTGGADGGGRPGGIGGGRAPGGGMAPPGGPR